MSRFVKIGERIINLDQVKFFERRDEGGALSVVVVMETERAWFESDSDPAPVPTREKPEIRSSNMNFTGTDAKLVWEKLCEVAEVWGLPGEMPDGDSV